MLLAIDIGNTNTVFALFRDETLVHSWRCKTESSRTVDEYAVFLSQLFQISKTGLDEIEDVIASSVVPDANFHLEGFCKKYLKCDLLFVGAANVDLEIDLDYPEEVGADRIVNAVAVKAYYKTPAVVVDFGTATTFDVIDEQGVYCGGVIAPGIRLSLEALAKRAAKLSQVNIEKPAKAIGKNTSSAMQSGLYWGYIGLIEGILGKIREEIGGKPYVIATGGLAPLYAQSTDMIDTVDDNLILKGLLEIHQSRKSEV